MPTHAWHTDRRLRLLLLTLAVSGLGVAWWHYPPENHFSVMRCTISFLGSPDPDRNPHGWRYYQAGMTALMLLLVSLAAERHAGLRMRLGKLALLSSGAIFAALLMVATVTWIPDTRGGHWFGMRTGQFHTRIAIYAIPVMGLGILVDAVALWWSGVRWRALWPFYVYAGIVGFGALKIFEWEQMCRTDHTLHHWPGDGLHSTPLWEWVGFTYLIGFLFWMSRCGTRFALLEAAPGTGREEKREVAQ